MDAIKDLKGHWNFHLRKNTTKKHTKKTHTQNTIRNDTWCFAAE